MKIRRSDILPDVPVPIPPGLVMAWPKTRATIPSGYALCDGLWYDPRDLTVGQVGQAATDATHTVQTPNMIDRFIAGAGNLYAVGATGGATTHTLSAAEMPVHAHGLNNHVHSGPSHAHTIDHSHAFNLRTTPSTTAITIQSGTSGGIATALSGIDTPNSGPAGTGNTGVAAGNTADAGSGNAHSTMPPYYAAYWIQKL